MPPTANKRIARLNTPVYYLHLDRGHRPPIHPPDRRSYWGWIWFIALMFLNGLIYMKGLH